MAVLTVALASSAGFVASAPTVLDVVTVLCDDSYPDGGYPVDLATLLPGRTIRDVDPQACVDGFVFQWDAANSKLLAYYADLSESADGPLIVLPNTDSSLDGKTVKLKVWSV